MSRLMPSATDDFPPGLARPASATSITVCDDQAGAETTNQMARDYIATNLANLSVSAPEVHVGEVAMGV